MSLRIYVDTYSGFRQTNGLASSRWTRKSTRLPLCSTQWYEPSATYFKVQSTKGKTYLLDTVQRRMNGRCKAALMAMNFWRDQALNWSPSILPPQRRPNSKLNHANTVTLPMPRFH